ncbi:hypothetical protein J1605_017326 [Eschrichtius robustus]|uniref:Basic proline-rich protein-like n=1 Tax=Eschrichtius robustus TaxID=9764 RepID=A0AB34I200_ESCRO|nr:hypothetical protein J1605_017326 [Eschrichtius robustus]
MRKELGRGRSKCPHGARVTPLRLTVQGDRDQPARPSSSSPNGPGQQFGNLRAHTGEEAGSSGAQRPRTPFEHFSSIMAGPSHSSPAGSSSSSLVLRLAVPSRGDPPPGPSQLCPCPAPAAGAGGPRGTNCGQCPAQDVLHGPRPSHARPAPQGRLPESAGSARNLGPAAATASAAGPDGFPQRTEADEAWRAGAPWAAGGLVHLAHPAPPRPNPPLTKYLAPVSAPDPPVLLRGPPQLHAGLRIPGPLLRGPRPPATPPDP